MHSTGLLRWWGASTSVELHVVFFFSSRRRHTRFDCDWSSDVCSSDLFVFDAHDLPLAAPRRYMIGQREVYTEGTRGYQVALFRDNDVGYAITGSVNEPEIGRASCRERV